MSQQPATYRAVFGSSEFRRLWLAHTLSVAGDQLARVALTILVYDRTASAGLAAVTYAVSYVPDFLGGALLAGIADRYSRRGVMVATDVARGVVVAVMALPGVPLAGQVGLLVVVQLLAAPFSAARQAVLPDILRGDSLVIGIGVISMTYQAGLVIGFGAGAVVVDAIGAAGALWVDSATFALSALVIRFGVRAHPPAPGAAPTVRRRRWSGVTRGWRLVGGNPRLRALLVIACCSGFYVVPEGLAVPVADEIGAGTAAVGWLLAANPVGTVLGMLVLKRISPDRRLRLLGPLTVASSLVLVPTGWQPGLVVLVLLWTASGAFSAHDMVTQAAYVAEVPPEERGHAVGVAIASLRAAQGLAIVVSGLVAQLVSPIVVITAAAVLGTVVGAGASLSWARASSGQASSGQASSGQAPPPADRGSIDRGEAGDEVAG
ncbi:arabinose efflux permease family protein [Saccharomonospora marina XMU15]|uniref:Arabinose efflux permease family protein n=1 Tax=Saccharomonospora marina XMU15 TaxID=882083 RepID=H5X0S9_9PSEU|nr:MFS transporter [Saccharomonospora marina]EHR50875.1 arabinose efflux permease family protein [Saccharomonospora marina XMU15]